MAQNVRFIILVIFIILLLSACNIGGTPTENPALLITSSPTPVPPLELIVTANTTVPFNEVGQVITYSYVVKNTSGQSLPGPLTLADENRTIECPAINTVGNNDDNFDTDETITCTGTYSITQADLDVGSVTNNATANIGGDNSNAASFPVTLTQNRTLTLSKAANPTTYDKVDQVITYTYVILNGGNVTLQGPFSIADNKLVVTTCTQPEDNLLSPNEEMSCTESYTIVQTDLDAGLVTNTATATNGETTSVEATTTVTKGSLSNLKITPDPNLVQYSTVSHTVVKGEWLWQIARCYGANPRQVVNANIGSLGNPAVLDAGMILSVPDIGRDRTPYGPQIGDNQVSSCAPIYRVQAGDTWENIAQRYRASASLLQKVNPLATLSPGTEIRIPFNSEGD